MTDKFFFVWCAGAVLLLASFTTAGWRLQEKSIALFEAEQERLEGIEAQATKAREAKQKFDDANVTMEQAAREGQWISKLEKLADDENKSFQKKWNDAFQKQKQAMLDEFQKWTDTHSDLNPVMIEEARRSLVASITEWSELPTKIGDLLPQVRAHVTQETPWSEVERRLKNALLNVEKERMQSFLAQRKTSLEQAKRSVDPLGKTLVLILATERLGDEVNLASQLQRVRTAYSTQFGQSSFYLVGKNSRTKWSPGMPLSVAAEDAFACKDLQTTFRRTISVRKALVGSRGNSITTLILWPSNVNPNDQGVNREAVQVPDKEGRIHLFWIGAGDKESAWLNVYFHRRVTRIPRGEIAELVAEAGKVLSATP